MKKVLILRRRRDERRPCRVESLRTLERLEARALLSALTIAQENQLPGTPTSQWNIVNGAGNPKLQGFATDISVNHGNAISFKINDNGQGAYNVNIYRMGYYQGDGARLVTTIPSSQAAQIVQPAPVSDPTTGEVDAGNWSVAASWAVPSDATSGIYFANLVPTNTAEAASQIIFIVRADESHSDILFQTSDSTWQAYNTWGTGSTWGGNSFGGNSLYQGSFAGTASSATPGRAYAVSYNRPLTIDGVSGGFGSYDSVWHGEYPMVYWLEENGYDVSYFTDVDSSRNGSLILNHKIYMDCGHDEYISGQQRSDIQAALAAGVNLAFMSGNEIYWKTRWANSLDSSATPYRTVVCYKESTDNQMEDPQDPPTWTGTWRDMRFSPPADGGQPENALTGNIYMDDRTNVDLGVPLQVPASDASLWFWKNTAVASLQAGQVATLGQYVVGYEVNEDLDNGFRPAGLIDLSSTTFSTQERVIVPWGTVVGAGTGTHSLTLYRTSAGALVFGAGTVQWDWGLGFNNWGPINEGVTEGPDLSIEQATVNLLANMGSQPVTLISGLVPATTSADRTPPTSTITSPSPGAVLTNGTAVAISGTATDAGGGVVAGVEVSVDGGQTWHPATGRANWTYTWAPNRLASFTIESRAVDDSGNLETPSAGITVSTSGPYSIWSSQTTPGTLDDSDTANLEVGVKFTSDVAANVLGVRFYKGPTNTGTHVGSLWSSTGSLLAQATFTNETTSGWQQILFSSPVAISPNTIYVVSYHTTVGHYSSDDYFFQNQGINNGPLHAPANSVNGPNGVYVVSTSSAFPTNTFDAANYWVDLVYQPISTDTTPPTAPSSLIATGSVATASLSWTASSDNVGVAGYNVYRSTTSGFTPSGSNLIGTTTAITYIDSGLSAGTYYYLVTAHDAAGNNSNPSNQASAAVTADTAAPTAPSNLAASGGAGSASLSWQASSDNVGVAGYHVYRSTTSGFTPSSANLVGTTTTTSDIDGGLSAGTYYYLVTAFDAAGNVSNPSNQATATVAPPAIKLIQDATTATGSSASNISVAFPSSTKAGDFLIVTGISSSPRQNLTIADSAGDTFVVAIGPVNDASQDVTEYVWYVASAKGGADTVTVTPSSADALELHVSEWSGISSAAPVDQTASANGQGTSVSSGSKTTTQSQELIYGYTCVSGTAAAGAGFTSLTLVDGDEDEYRIQGTAGSVAATFSQNSSGSWSALMVTFKAGSTDAQPPTAPTGLTVTGSVGTAALSWTASTDNVGVTGYNVYRSTTSGFTPSGSNLAGATTATSFTNTGLAAGTYYYLVTAQDAAGNTSNPSNQAPATVTTNITAPTNLVATGGLGSAVLTWTAATDSLGVTGYTVYRSTTSGFLPGSGNQIAQPTATTYTDTGLAAATYYYLVTAHDAVGNVSGSSNQAPASVTADTTPPTVNLTAPAAGATVSGTVTVSANATDNVAMAGVQFTLDGLNLGAEVTTAPYTVSWNTTTATNGAHTLGAIAYDTSGNHTSAASVAVTVANTGPPGLVAAYSLDEGSGTTANDSSGNHNTGTVANAAWVAGKYGSALAFTGAANSMVTISDSPSLDLTTGMTLEAWVNPASLNQNWDAAISKDHKNSSNDISYALYAAADTNERPAVHILVGGNDVGVQGTAVLALKTWTFLAATYDGATLKLYVNGTQVATKSISGSITTTVDPLHLGGDWDDEMFTGSIDNVRIYKAALTQAQIQTDMTTALGSSSATSVSLGLGSPALVAAAISPDLSRATVPSVARTTASPSRLPLPRAMPSFRRRAALPAHSVAAPNSVSVLPDNLFSAADGSATSATSSPRSVDDRIVESLVPPDTTSDPSSSLVDSTSPAGGLQTDRSARHHRRPGR